MVEVVRSNWSTTEIICCRRLTFRHFIVLCMLLASGLFFVSFLHNNNGKNFSTSVYIESFDEEKHQRRLVVVAIEKLLKISNWPFISNNVSSSLMSAFNISLINNFASRDKLRYSLMKTVLASVIMRPTNSSQRRPKFAVAAIGGSTTVPRAVKPEEGFVGLFCSWLAGSMQEIGIDFTCENAALGATGSNYFAHCVTDILDLAKFDVLLVEFSINDLADSKSASGFNYQPYPGRPLEELIRKVLQKNPFIHIILVNLWLPKNRLLVANPVCKTSVDDAFLDVAKFYDLTSIETKYLFCFPNDTVNIHVTRNKTASLADFYLAKKDFMHPSEAFHRIATEFLVSYFRTVVDELVENLQQDDGKTTLAELATAIRRRYLPKTLFPTSRNSLEAQCFFNWRNSSELSDKIIRASSDLYQSPMDERLVLVFTNKGSNISFHFDDLRQVANNYCSDNSPSTLPRLALLYGHCRKKASKIRVSSNFTFSDGSSLIEKLEVEQVGFTHHFFQLITGGGNSTEVLEPGGSHHQRASLHHHLKKVATLDLQLEKLSDIDCPLRITTVIIYYECR